MIWTFQEYNLFHKIFKFPEKKPLKNFAKCIFSTNFKPFPQV